MRALLLWCAQNEWLSENVPRWGFVKRAVKRFMPGEDFDSALKASVAFKTLGIGAVFSKLGENIKAMSDATAAVEQYEMVLKTASEAGLEPEISVKPTQVGLDIDPDATFANLNRLAEAAARAKGFLWIDMEGSAYTDRTLDLYNRVHSRHPAIGMDRHQLEVHMLYGIQSAQQVRLAAEGYRVKDLIAYGDAWYAWYLRRLAERPANVMFVARQMIG